MKHKKIQLQEGQGIYIVATVALVLGILFAIICDIWHLQFPVALPCLMNEKWHLYCPGCGGTRAVFSMLRGHILQSLEYNPIPVYGTVLFLYYYIGTTMAVCARGRRVYFHARKWMIIGFGILLLWTSIIRNVLAVCHIWDYIGEVAPYW